MAITQANLKRLWGSSGNECAHPDCSQEIVDTGSGTVIGEICHIRAQSEGGPRYDPDYEPDELDEPSNLILLCPTHHTQVDKNPGEYTVETLEEWKEEQERTGQETGELSDEKLSELVPGTADIHVDEGSFIVTQNQMGGQVADEITNIGPQPRRFTPQAKKALSQELAGFGSPTVKVTGIMGDGESLALAEQIKGILEDAGWTVEGVNQVVRTGVTKGVVLEGPQETELMHNLGTLLMRAGLDATGAIDENKDKLDVIVGSNL